MNKDRKLVWVVVYLIGIGFLVVVLPSLVNPPSDWSGAHTWAYLLFMVCTGIALVSSASATRQRIELSERIEKLEKKLEEQKLAQNQTPGEIGKQFITREHLVGSVN